jgi:hypothetical protein
LTSGTFNVNILMVVIITAVLSALDFAAVIITTVNIFILKVLGIKFSRIQINRCQISFLYNKRLVDMMRSGS